MKFSLPFLCAAVLVTPVAYAGIPRNEYGGTLKSF